MRGLSKRKGSNNWQGRFRIPKPLWDRRDELVALGVSDLGKSQEFMLSMQTPNKADAERRYRIELTAWDNKMDAWESLLDGGPVDLTFMDAVALAGTDAKDFLEKHKTDPRTAPGPRRMVDATCDNLHAHFSRQSLEDGQAVFELGRELRRLPLPELPQRLVDMLSSEPEGPRRILLAAVANALVRYREGLGWMRAPKIAEQHGLTLSKDGRRELAQQVAGYREDVWKSLQAMLQRDYSEPEWVKGVPPLDQAPAIKKRRADKASRSSEQSLSLGVLIDDWARRKGVRPNTERQNRSILGKFATFIGHDDASRFTKKDVRRWRDALQDEGQLTTKTINDRYLAALKAVLAIGVSEHDLPANVADGVRDTRKGPPPTGSKGYSEDQALTILNATFKGTERKLSHPHQRALFWIPWILAFTGLRVSEIAQLQGRHVKEEDGIWHLVIDPSDGSTKGDNAWTTGVHRQLLRLGFVDMVEAVGDGPLFYEPYPAGTDLNALEKTHRAKYSGDRIAMWIKDDLGIPPPNNRPNHAWRHRFTTLSRGCNMDKEARDYMLGSRPKTDAREGYGDWSPAVLDREINKLPELEVVDTGWRPPSF